jgi:hypothetical protein
MTDEYRLIQEGMPVAWANSLREIHHYAAVYSQDGPIKLQQRVKGRWKVLKV